MNKFQNVVFGYKVFILNEHQEVLIIKRKTALVYHDYWDVPGGILSDGDTLMGSITSKVKEETNLGITKIILTISSSKMQSISVDASLLFRNIYLAFAQGEIQLNEQITEYRWLPIAELSEYSFLPDADFQAVLLKIPEIVSSLDLQKKYSLLF